MAESRRPRPNKRTRERQRRSYQPALPSDVRAATGSDPSDEEREQSARERLEVWKAKIAHARRLRTDWETRYKVETLERFYLGRHTNLGSDDVCEIFLNHFAATVQTQRPSLLPTKLSFLVEPKPGQPERQRLLAKLQAGVLDAIAAQDNHLMKSLRLAGTQAFFRIGVLKNCYDPRMTPNPRAGEPLLGEDDQALVGMDGEELKEPEQLLSDEVYRWKWVNARNMLLPDEGPDTTRWTWIAEEIEVTLEEAREDTSFPKAKREQLQANGRLRELERPTLSTDRIAQEQAQQWFRYVEVWDIRQKRRLVWADGQDFLDDFLVDEPYQDGVEDHPYDLLIPLPIIAPEPSPWPKPLTYDWLPIQQQYNIMRTLQIEAGKRAARKIFYDDATFPDADEAVKALQSSNDLEAVKVNDAKTNIPVVVGDGAQSPDVARNVPFLRADWQVVTGATGSRLGAPNADTATEAVIEEQSAAVRDSELRTLVIEWLTEAGRKMLQLVKQTLTLDLWISLKTPDDKDFQEFMQSPGLQAYIAMRIGPENVAPFLQMAAVMPGMMEQLKAQFGELKPLRVSRSMLQMEADVVVLPSTIRPLYRAQLLQLMGLLGPAALMSPTLVEEVLLSFELPQGDRIAGEIMANLRQQQMMQQVMQMQKAGGAPGTPRVQSAASPMGMQNPLAAVNGGAI